MAENRAEILVGTGVLVLALGFFLYLMNATGSTTATGEGTANYSASFRAVDGIAVGTEVRMAGVKLGTVTEITLNRETFRADTTIAIPADIALPDDTAMVISSEGLLGGNYVELVPGGSPFNLEPGDEILETQGSVSLIALLSRFVSGGSE